MIALFLLIVASTQTPVQAAPTRFDPIVTFRANITHIDKKQIVVRTSDGYQLVFNRNDLTGDYRPGFVVLNIRKSLFDRVTARPKGARS